MKASLENSPKCAIILADNHSLFYLLSSMAILYHVIAQLQKVHCSTDTKGGQFSRSFCVQRMLVLTTDQFLDSKKYSPSSFA